MPSGRQTAEGGILELCNNDDSQPMVKRTGRDAPALTAAVCLAGLTVLSAGCPDKVNLIQALELAPGQTLALDVPVHFQLKGQGTCKNVKVDWGDDTPADNLPIAGLLSLTNNDFTHTFKGWPGGKTVTAEATSGCEGKVSLKFSIEPSTLQFGWNRDQAGAITTCFAAPNAPTLAKHSLVHITSPARPVVNFGCPLNNCIFDADGRNPSSAAVPFPFAGLREFSLVLRIGQDVFQGGKDVRFTTASGGTLELCENADINQTHESGGWRVDVHVDQLGGGSH